MEEGTRDSWGAPEGSIRGRPYPPSPATCAPSRLANLRYVSRRRKLGREEVAFLIRQGEGGAYGLEPYGPPGKGEKRRTPRSGDIHICSRINMGNLKKDGLDWIKRPNSERLREDHVKLKLADKASSLFVYYSKLPLGDPVQDVHGGGSRYFFRWRYLLEGYPMQFVQYLDETEAKHLARSSPIAQMLKKSIMDPFWLHQMVVDDEEQLLVNSTDILNFEPAAVSNDCDKGLEYRPMDDDAGEFYSNGNLGLDDLDLLSLLGAEGLEELRSDCFDFDLPKEEVGEKGKLEGQAASSSEQAGTVEPTFIDILDMSPSWDFVAGGGKVIICLSSTIPVELRHRKGGIFVNFGDCQVGADVIAPQVIRCFSPPCPRSCACKVSVRLDFGGKLKYPEYSSNREYFFSYRPAPEDLGSGGSRASYGAPIGILASHNTGASIDAATGVETYKKRPRSEKTKQEELRDTIETRWSLREARGSKIRVVERLGEVAQAGASSKISGYHSPENSSPVLSRVMHQIHLESHLGSPLSPESGLEGSVVDGLLDDIELSELGSEELEDLLNRLVVRVMNQLAQIASSDAALRSELTALDGAGYSLLHYACTYNLVQLVPRLLDSAVDPNQRTGDGMLQTPLHLAASTGSREIAMSLIRSGAALEAVDVEGHKPADIARYMGFESLSTWLIDLEKHSPRHRRQSTEDSNVCSNNCNFISTPASAADASGLREANHSFANKSAGTTSQLLQSALAGLSLHDKCAVSLSLGGPKSSQNLLVIGDETTSTTDSSAIFSDNEKGLLECAMSMMGPEELDELEKQARVIQQNMRAWALRRNYMTLRTAAKTLQMAWRCRQKGRSDPPGDISSASTLTPHGACRGADEHNQEQGRGPGNENQSPLPQFGPGVGRTSSAEMISASTAVQAAARGHLARKHFSQLKLETTALLVLRRSPQIRNWIAQQRSGNG